MAFIKYSLRRVASLPITLLVITAILYGFVMLAPAEERAALYFPPRLPRVLTPERLAQLTQQLIEEHGLDDPYWAQYGRWLRNLVRGDWGWSPTYNTDVFTLLMRRTPVTAELTLFAVITLIPLGLAAGAIAGWRENSGTDALFRLLAFIATSVPPFILGLVLLSVFYVGLRWFPAGRTSFFDISMGTSATFETRTGFLTIDGLLNRRPEVTLDALRHLVLPALTVNLLHWATLGRVTRAAIIEEREEDYIVAARARGLPNRLLIWRHALRNALLPALTSSILSAASLVTGVFVIERVFDIKGLSEIVTSSIVGTPDSALAMGVAVVSTLLVIPLMLAFDILKALADPRLREGEAT